MCIWLHALHLFQTSANVWSVDVRLVNARSDLRDEPMRVVSEVIGTHGTQSSEWWVSGFLQLQMLKWNTDWKKKEAVKKFMVMQPWPEGDEVFVPSVKTNILERKRQYLLVEMKRELFNRGRGFQSCGFSHLMNKKKKYIYNIMSIPNLLAPEREIEFIRHVLIFPIGHCSGPAFRPTPSNQGVTFFKRSDFFSFFSSSSQWLPNHSDCWVAHHH